MMSPQVARAASAISFRILCASSRLALRSGDGRGEGASTSDTCHALVSLRNSIRACIACRCSACHA